MKSVILFGPFVGDTRWEMYRFVPYLIYLKSVYKSIIKSIVLTRPESFDLYGKYADVLINLNINDDYKESRIGFKTNSISVDYYKKLIYKFNQYHKKHNILENVVPDIEDERYRIKWQFPRQKMFYNFIPRDKNKSIISELFNPNKENVIIDNSKISNLKLSIKSNKYNIITTNYLNDHLSNLDSITYDSNITKFGVIIELIRNCKLFIGNLDSKYTLLSFCMKQSPILINEKRDDVDIKTLNPYKISYTKTDEVDLDNILKRVL